MIRTTLLLALSLSGPAPLLVHEGHTGDAQGSGTVNTVDAAHHSINISHAPIRALHWPAMTMDFQVNPGVDLTSIKQGSKVVFTLIQGEGGKLELHMIRPADGK
jgi:Cu/Ag efflux protein CusF